MLKDFGLGERESQIYIFLGKYGAQKGGNISKQLKINKGQVYRTLKNLHSKGLVELTLQQPTRYSAIPFKKVIESLIKTKQEEVVQIEKSKKELLSDWENISKPKPVFFAPKFTVLEGNRKIFSKISNMLKNTKKKLLVVSSAQGLIRADNYGIIDEAIKHPLKKQIIFRFITEITKETLNKIKNIYQMAKIDLKFKGKTPGLGSASFPRMVIRDDTEILFFITPKPIKSDEACFCTNCQSIIQAFNGVFEDLWCNSVDLEQKFIEFETGKPAPEMRLIKDKKKARKTYFDTLNKAKKEILIITSSKRLIGLANNIYMLHKWCKNGVSIKIMAPITSENVEIAAKILECCEIRHIPSNYSEMTIIDNEKLFQFKNPTTENNEQVLNYKNVFFTNDEKYINQTKIMINNIWENVHELSTLSINSPNDPTINDNVNEKIPLHSVAKLNGITHLKNERPFNVQTEKDLFDLIRKTKKQKPKKNSGNIVKQFGNYGRAIIHPPKHLNLPEMEFNIYHFNKESTLGIEDSIIIGVLRDSPSGVIYVPAAFIGDNPKALNSVKIIFKDLIPIEKFHLVEKDKLQVRIQGDNLFCGWTVPIHLIDDIILPPASILLEGYGKVLTKSFSNSFPSGYRMDQARNYIESFVTFYHPESKYSGPGTDGFFAKEFIMKIYKQ